MAEEETATSNTDSLAAQGTRTATAAKPGH